MSRLGFGGLISVGKFPLPGLNSQLLEGRSRFMNLFKIEGQRRHWRKRAPNGSFWIGALPSVGGLVGAGEPRDPCR